MSGTPTELRDTLASEQAEAAGRRPEGRAAIGRVLAGRYELLALLGSGGMGMVFSARDRELDEVVALKMLHMHRGPTTDDWIRREVKLARRITHRNVARTFELGEDGGARFLTMEFVDGEPLSRILERQQRLSPARALPIFMAVCEALEAAHEAGIVHRDIKPDNVLVEARGRVVVTDFGVAGFKYESQETGASGTPAYMAPEQVEGGTLTPQTDLYALGATMFEVLTGSLPWPSEALVPSLMRRLEEPPPDPQALVPTLPIALAAIVRRCLARAPADRPGSARELAGELRAVLDKVSTEATTTALSIQAHSARDTPVEGTPARTLAVLPFPPSPEVDAYVAESLAEDLVDSLSALKGLRVRARAKIEGEDRDPQRVGQQLGVALIVEGSLRRIGAKLRVGLRLIDVGSGYQSWAERFEVAPEQLLGVAESATRAIAGALGLGEQAAPRREVPSDPAAIDLYLRARHHYQMFTTPDVRRAVELFTEAEALDPGNPMIASGLSMAAVRLSYTDFGLTREMLPRGKAAAERAIARAPQLGEPHLALAHVCLVSGDPVTAARHARAAIARAPSLADAHELLGRLLFEAGRTTDAIHRLQTALELDPRLSVARWELIRAAAFDGDWERHDRLVAQSPGPDRERRVRWPLHVRFAGWRRDLALLATMETELAGDTELPAALRDMLLLVVRVYRGAEPTGPALQALMAEMAEVGASPRQRAWVLQQLAELAGFAGDVPMALDLLEQASDAGVFDLAWIDRCPLFMHLHQEPGYLRVRARIQERADAIAEAIWGG